MPRPLPSLPLGNLTGGFNRFEKQAEQNQIFDGENVSEDRGDLVRRPAFKSIATSAPFIMPGGMVDVAIYNLGTVSFSAQSNRVLNASVSIIGGGAGGGILLVGCREIFEGVEWMRVVQPATLAGRQYLRPQMVSTAWGAGDTPTDANFTDIPWYLDSTRWVAGDDDAQPLFRDGRISWHKSSVSSWAQVSLNSLTRYWLALNITNTPPDFNTQTFGSKTALLGNGGGNLTIQAPGIRCFRFERVTGIFPVAQHGTHRIFVMSERGKRRGQEKGAQIGVIANPADAAETMRLAVDEGSGCIGQVTKGATVDDAGTPTASGASFGSAGSILTKFDERYNWRQNQFGGDVLQANIVAASPTTVSFTFTPTNPSYETEFEGCVIQATTAGGVALGEYRRIYKSEVSGNNVILRIEPAFSATPTGAARFSIWSKAYDVSPGAESKETAGSGSSRNFYHQEILHGNTTAHTQTLVAVPASLTDTDDADNNFLNSFTNWAIDRETRWDIPAEQHWDTMFDTVTREFYFSNGAFPVLRWDTKRLRVLDAITDRTNARVQQYTGILEDFQAEGTVPSTLPGDLLKEHPPLGRFITDFHGRTVIAGDPGDPFRVYWSAPGGYNDIWPKIYEALIRDPDNQPIKGMTVLNDELVVWTPSSVHAAALPDETGMLNFAVKSRGIGFINHNAVDRLPVDAAHVLIGPNADGVYLYSGAEPTAILDDWERVLDGGANTSYLHRAAGAVSLHHTRYYLAVPSAGSNVNDKILVFDYVAKTWSVWNAPFGGCSFIAREQDNVGRERMLFGFEDGHVAVLVEQDRDDGVAFTGRARSIPLQVDSTTQAPQALMVTALETGSTNTISVKAFLNERGVSVQSFSGPWDQGSALYGGGIYGTSLWGGTGFKTRKIPFRAGSRGEIIQFEVSGSKPFRLRNCELLMHPVAQRSR